MKAVPWLVFVVVGFFAYVLISSNVAISDRSAGDGTVTAVKGEDFRVAVLENPKPVLVEFSAEWCAACEKAAPWVRQIAGRLENELVVASVDVDEAPELARSYGVRGVPSFVLIDGGRVIDKFSGLNEAMVASRLEAAGFAP